VEYLKISNIIKNIATKGISTIIIDYSIPRRARKINSAKE